MITVRILAAALLVLQAAFSQQAGQMATWTSNDGRSLQASFVTLTGEVVTLRINGNPIQLPLSRLSPESQAQAKRMAARGAVVEAPQRSQGPAATPVIMPEDPSIPALYGWKSNYKSPTWAQDKDLIFLINRGWMEGRLVSVDEAGVTFEASSILRFPRSEISLIELADWRVPSKRRDTQFFKLRFVLEGLGERGTLYFNNGCMIHKVDAAPVFESGGDGDDKLEVTSTRLSFHKGRDDRNLTKLVADLTVLVPAGGLLDCDVDLAKENGFAGPQNLTILDPSTGVEMVAFRKPFEGSWSRFEIPLERLKPGSKGYKTDAIGINTKGGRPLAELAAPPAAADPNEPVAARIMLCTGKPVIGHLLSADADQLTLLDLSTARQATLDRSLVALIELHDWEVPIRSGSLPKPTDPNQSPPLRFTVTGTSSSQAFAFDAGDGLARLIVPPHHVYGRDADDHELMASEALINWRKLNLDQSPSQMEMVAEVRCANPAGLVIELQANYVNSWAGYAEYTISNALSRKRLESHTFKTPVLTAPLKIQRSELFAP